MESTSPAIFVDPTCPFAWITRQWLGEVSALTGQPIEVELMSLSAVNEGRELDDWYRDYNDNAWLPARVAAALLASENNHRWPDFYQGFGQRRHVDGLRDDLSNLRTTIAELDLPATLVDEAHNTAWDEDLRGRTATACQPLDGQGGTPILRLHGRHFFGPVLTAIPRGQDALRLWEAVTTLAQTPAFSEIKTARGETLATS